jgi:hypothetical protein
MAVRKIFNRLISENLPEVRNPSSKDVERYLNRLNSFCILDAAETGDYVQTAGTKFNLLIEYRKHSGDSFKHVVLRTAPKLARAEVQVHSTSGPISVRKNEVLKLSKFQRDTSNATLPRVSPIHLKGRSDRWN